MKDPGAVAHSLWESPEFFRCATALGGIYQEGYRGSEAGLRLAAGSKTIIYQYILVLLPSLIFQHRYTHSTATLIRFGGRAG